MGDRMADIGRGAAIGAIAGATLLLALALLVPRRSPDPAPTAEPEGRPAVEQPQPTMPQTGVEWPPGAAAWITVGGTTIDAPVMPAPADDPEFYLSHDEYGNPNLLESAYLDPETPAEGPVSFVFGHRAWGTHAFTELADTHDQGSFDGLAQGSWEVPGRGRRAMAPVCALRVDADDPQTLSRSWSGRDAALLWARGLLARSSARAKDADALLDASSQVVTLVTCSDREEGGFHRTVLVMAVLPAAA